MGTVWRPTVRCDSTYRDYIDSIYKSTSLDKNQILRLMMFVAAHSNEFKQILSEYKKDGVTQLPNASWRSWEDALWLNQTYKKNNCGATPESIENKEVIVEKGEGGVTKVVLSSLF